jgi:hypothetical protein
MKDFLAKHRKYALWGQILRKKKENEEDFHPQIVS